MRGKRILAAPFRLAPRFEIAALRAGLPLLPLSWLLFLRRLGDEDPLLAGGAPALSVNGEEYDPGARIAKFDAQPPVLAADRGAKFFALDAIHERDAAGFVLNRPREEVGVRIAVAFAGDREIWRVVRGSHDGGDRCGDG